MKDDLRPFAIEKLLKKRDVANAADDELRGGRERCMAEIELELMEAELPRIKQDKLLRTELGKAPGKRGTDRSARSGDQDASSFNGRSYLSGIECRVVSQTAPVIFAAVDAPIQGSGLRGSHAAGRESLV